LVRVTLPVKVKRKFWAAVKSSSTFPVFVVSVESFPMAVAPNVDTKFSSIDNAGVVPNAEPLPITRSSALSSSPIWKSCALPSNTIFASSAPASPIVSVGVAPNTETSPAKVVVVPPVGICITAVSASFLIVTSFVEPWPVSIKPSAAV